MKVAYFAKLACAATAAFVLQQAGATPSSSLASMEAALPTDRVDLHLYLPLQHQGGGAEDQDRPVIQQGGEHRARRERQRLADTHFIGQQ